MRSRSIPTAARIAPRRSQVDPSGPNPLLRLEKSKPQLDEIETQIQAARSGALPKSVLAKACKYTLTLWTRLTRFMEHPELELCTNLAENAMLPVALRPPQLDTHRKRNAHCWAPVVHEADERLAVWVTMNCEAFPRNSETRGPQSICNYMRRDNLVIEP